MTEFIWQAIGFLVVMELARIVVKCLGLDAPQRCDD